MILMYHKVDIIAPTVWWVTADRFAQHLTQLQSRKVQFVYLDDYDPHSNDQVAITFDDAYENTYRLAFPELRQRSIPFEVFVIGSRIGEWNDFDRSEPRTRFASLDHLLEMADGGGRIQWHTRTHPDLPGVDEPRLAEELSIPWHLRKAFARPHLSWFSYPSGCYDDRVVDGVRSRFAGAVAVLEGQPVNRWTWNRVTVDEHTCFG
jgi:peptidoglycan/xylan/chitin deacetylase (PgdA/CDA1 family)